MGFYLGAYMSIAKVTVNGLDVINSLDTAKSYLQLLQDQLSLSDHAEKFTPIDNLASSVRDSRKSHSMSREDLAMYSDLGVGTINRIESGSDSISIKNLVSVLDTLGLKLYIGEK